MYEDGDEEDLNDKEFREGYELLNQSNNEAVKTLGEDNDQDDSDNHNDKSGGETEGSYTMLCMKMVMGRPQRQRIS